MSRNAGGPRSTTLPGPTTANVPTTPQQAGPADGRTSPRLIANATAYAPVGRRQQHVLLVRSCPLCAGAHLHRGAQHGGRRRAGCGRGEYLVRTTAARGLPRRAAA